MLGEGPTYGINGIFGSPEKKFNINFSQARVKFCLCLHYNADNSYLFVNGKEMLKIKADNENVNFPTQFCLGTKYRDYREVSLKGTVYEFSVNYNTIDNCNILNIHKSLMVKNNIK